MKLKILHLTNDSSIGGAERLLIWLARAYDHQAFEMRFCTLKPSGTFQREMASLGEKVYSLEMSKLGDFFRARRSFYNLIEDFQPDIVHTHLLYAGWLGLNVVAKNPGVRLIHTRHYGSFFEKHGFWFIKAFDRYVMRKSPFLIAVSKSVERYLVETLGVSAAKVTVILNGIDLDESPKEGSSQDKLLVEKLRKIEAFPKIATIASFRPGKGHPLLIESAKQIIKQYPNAHFFLIGDGATKRLIATEIEKYDLKRYFTFSGFLPHVRGVMKMMDAIVIPSEGEGFGLVACEAMAARVPVIANSVEGIVEIVEPDRTGFLFEKNNSQSLAVQLSRVLEDKPLRMKVVEEAGKVVQEKFDIRIMTRNLENTYRSMVSQNNEFGNHGHA